MPGKKPSHWKKTPLITPSHWKQTPLITLKMTGESQDPAKQDPSGARSGEQINRQLHRTAYRNRLVDHLTKICDGLHQNTFKTLNLTFLNLKDQVFGLTAGQLEELIYAFTLLEQLQNVLSYDESKRAHTKHRNLLAKLQKGLVLE